MNQTVMKVNVSMQIVRQSGDKFLYQDLKLGTKNQIRKYEVGACYFDSKVARVKAYELICDKPNDVIDIRDTLYDARSEIKSFLTSIQPGAKDQNGNPVTIADLLEYIHNKNKKDGTVIKLSPYSVQIKVTMQHVVPKDVVVPFSNRYHENKSWYSSSIQVLEVRIPLLPCIDSNESLNEIFDRITKYIEGIPQLKHTGPVARPTQDVIKELIGIDRFRKLLEEKKDRNSSPSGPNSLYQDNGEALFNDDKLSDVLEFNGSSNNMDS